LVKREEVTANLPYLTVNNGRRRDVSLSLFSCIFVNTLSFYSSWLTAHRNDSDNISAKVCTVWSGVFNLLKFDLTPKKRRRRSLAAK